jgi:hypothetical protein
MSGKKPTMISIIRVVRDIERVIGHCGLRLYLFGRAEVVLSHSRPMGRGKHLY